MMRAKAGDIGYWKRSVDFDLERIEKMTSALRTKPSGNPVYDPQYSFLLAERNLRIMLRRYSYGDAISELPQYFPGLLDAWELSNKLADEVCREHSLMGCRDWTFSLDDLNHYNWCFWLVGLASALEVPDDEWSRLLALIGGEGEDALLDRVIASRQSGRRIGVGLLHGKPYARLLKTLEASRDQQAALLREFVDHWYPELARPGNRRLWWYDYGDPIKNPLEMGSYFGRWCIEAVAVAKAFGIDDSLCLDHPYYPGDLIQDGRSPRYPDSAPMAGADMSQIKFGGATGKRSTRNWLSRLLLGPDRRQ